jgi:hypothetical protein
MSIDRRKRQKQQERRAAKRKAKQHELSREKHTGLAQRLAAAAKYPVLHSRVTEDLWTKGLGWVCLSRELPNGTVAFAVFLVDRYCLGVKNAMGDITSRSAYDQQIAKKMCSNFTSRQMTPAAIRKLVEKAVEYARSLGLEPHPDYPKTKSIFGDINAGESLEEFEFGQDGKPYFIAGPNDTPERCRRILSTLIQSCGVGGFHYLVPLADPSFFPDALKQQKARVIGPDDTGEIRAYPMDFSKEWRPPSE